jgi:hypothetical protein
MPLPCAAAGGRLGLSPSPAQGFGAVVAAGGSWCLLPLPCAAAGGRTGSSSRPAQGLPGSTFTGFLL